MATTITISRPNLTRAAAAILAQAAQNAAMEQGIEIAVGVVDAGGQVVLVDRMDGAASCCAPLAQSKARSAMATLAPTATWFATTQPGQPDWGFNLALGGRFNAMPGGIPIVIDGQCVGAVGVSGGDSAQDVACAEAALRALSEVIG